MIHEEYLLHRHEANPIIKPMDFPGGGVDGVRNCGQTTLGDETILLVSVDHRADGYRGREGRTTHVARSADGVHFEIDPEPFFLTPTPDEQPLYSQLDQHPIDTRVSKVVGKTRSYLLAPLAPYEQNGRVPNVVFPCGAIADYEQDRLRVYYGAADTSVCLATGSIGEIVDACLREL